MHEDKTDDGATIDARELSPLAGARTLRLVVFGDEMITTYPLPREGHLTIGRGEQCDVRIDHALISREHARITTRGGLWVEDLGSRNGTRVRGEKLEANAPRSISPGQVIELGSTMAVLQESGGPSRPHHLSTHGYFEARLEEECARREGRRTELAILRLHAGQELDAATVTEVLAEVLPSSVLAASYAPGEYELLLPDTSAARAEELSRRLLEGLDSPGARTGLAVYPADGRTADALLQRACAAIRPSESAPEPEGEEPVILDPAMRDLYRMGERVAQGSISVLILGETGAGKEVFAEAIHAASPRRGRRFVRINCAALAETLLESELFGHEKGAFTGAIKAKPGLLEIANGGTVMLDELGEMPLPTQAKLLRALEQRQVLRVGGLEPRAIDVRFVSATNRDLEADVVRGTFRRDLYFRLNGVTLMIPPLRERKQEIEPLARRFAARAARELGKEQAPHLSPRAISLLVGYAWPGNIRELKNVMERAVLLAPGDELGPEHLPFEKMTIPWTTTSTFGAAGGAAGLLAPAGTAEGSARGDDADLDEDERAEKRRIIEALESCGGNQTRAAKVLGIGRRTLTAKLTKYEMPRPKKGA